MGPSEEVKQDPAAVPPEESLLAKNTLSREQDRRRTLFFICGLSVFSAPLFAVIYWKLGSPAAAWCDIAIIPFLLFTYVIWRFSRSVTLAANWMLGLGYILFFISASFTGGLDGPGISWSLSVPIAATLLCDWRSGTFWLVLVLIKISFFYWAERFGVVFLQQYTDREHWKMAYYVSVAGIAVFSFVLALISEYFRERYAKKLQESNQQLKDALNNVQTLRGLLPICAWCKKIRNDKGYWSQVDVYFKNYTQLQFSHGICPECKDKEMEHWKKTREEK